MEKELKQVSEYEGCLGIISQTLRKTYVDYVNALVFTWLNKEKYTEYSKVYNEWLYYKDELLTKNRIERKIKKGKQITESDKLFLQMFGKIEIRHCNKKIVDFVTLYQSKKRDISDCEAFYMSENYKIFTLNRGPAGLEVIQSARGKAKDLISKKNQRRDYKHKNVV